MATLAVSFTFPTDAQSFVGAPGVNSTTTYNAGTGNPAGSLQSSISGKSHFNTNTWTRNMTYEAMGVPSGSTITAITSASMDMKCTAFTTGGTGNELIANLLDSVFNASVSIDLGDRAFSALDSVWVTTTGAGATGMNTPSNTTVRVQFAANMFTGSSNSAVVTILQDNLNFTLTYTPPAVAYIPPRRPATALVNRIIIV